MRVALISDVHGNRVALDAVVADFERVGVDQIVCLGDVAQGGPQPAEALDGVRELGCPVVMGNSDEFLLRVPTNGAEPVTPRLLEVREWTLAQLLPEHERQLRSFAPTVSVELGSGRRLLAFHGSPRSFDDVLLPESEVGEALAGAEADVLAGGHTHLQWARRVGGGLFANPGSVGLAYDRHQPEDEFKLTPVAEYAVVDDAGPSVEFRRVPFDAERLVAAARASGHPYADELAGQWRA